jgi:hypothetical protein
MEATMTITRIATVSAALFLTITSGSLVLAPSSRVLAQGKDPERIHPTHFQCYEVRQELKKELKRNPVVLDDQFNRQAKKSIRQAVYLCTPILIKDGVRYEDPRTHLVCYVIEPPSQGRPPNVAIENQFGTEELVLGGAKVLCVPSTKKVLAPATKK